VILTIYLRIGIGLRLANQCHGVSSAKPAEKKTVIVPLHFLLEQNALKNSIARD